MSDEKKIDLLSLIKNAIDYDAELRQKYQIGDKFRFVKDKLQALLVEAEKHSAIDNSVKKIKTISKTAEDEVLVYVYLFNAQGLTVQSWARMLSPHLFYEYSVNRPIYSQKSSIEALLRSKINRAQHGYLTVIVKQKDILLTQQLDSIGGALIKVREGGLAFEKMVSFFHNDQEYVVNEEGFLVHRSVES